MTTATCELCVSAKTEGKEYDDINYVNNCAGEDDPSRHRSPYNGGIHPVKSLRERTNKDVLQVCGWFLICPFPRVHHAFTLVEFLKVIGDGSFGLHSVVHQKSFVAHSQRWFRNRIPISMGIRFFTKVYDQFWRTSESNYCGIAKIRCP